MQHLEEPLVYFRRPLNERFKFVVDTRAPLTCLNNVAEDIVQCTKTSRVRLNSSVKRSNSTRIG